LGLRGLGLRLGERARKGEIREPLGISRSASLPKQHSISDTLAVDKENRTFHCIFVSRYSWTHALAEWSSSNGFQTERNSGTVTVTLVAAPADAAIYGDPMG
jgi:hypothetical protein